MELFCALRKEDHDAGLQSESVLIDEKIAMCFFEWAIFQKCVICRYPLFDRVCKVNFNYSFVAICERYAGSTWRTDRPPVNIFATKKKT